ncbi:TcmI family type II polyketide cyclase [Micromonospora siamensis]|nr:TcmI family type II polyketide cyclase [Micromonospora siamensis]
MSRLLIVSRISPGSEGRVAQIFAESDATELPALTGVRHRSLYCLHDLLVHLVETAQVDADALAAARSHPLYLQVNERLSAHTTSYLPTWRSPRDAVAGCFYRWDATGPDATGIRRFAVGG